QRMSPRPLHAAISEGSSSRLPPSASRGTRTRQAWRPARPWRARHATDVPRPRHDDRCCCGPRLSSILDRDARRESALVDHAADLRDLPRLGRHLRRDLDIPGGFFVHAFEPVGVRTVAIRTPVALTELERSVAVLDRLVGFALSGVGRAAAGKGRGAIGARDGLALEAELRKADALVVQAGTDGVGAVGE